MKTQNDNNKVRYDFISVVMNTNDEIGALAASRMFSNGWCGFELDKMLEKVVEKVMKGNGENGRVLDGMGKMSFEGLVIKWSERFSKEVVEKSKKNLNK